MKGVDTPWTRLNRIFKSQIVMSSGRMITRPVRNTRRRRAQKPRSLPRLLAKAAPRWRHPAPDDAQAPRELHEIIGGRQRRDDHHDPDGDVAGQIPAAQVGVAEDEKDDR